MATKYGHLRLVKPDEIVYTDIQEPTEAKPEPTWDQVPTSLAETADVLSLIPTNDDDLENFDLEKIETIVHNLQTVLETVDPNWTKDLGQFADWEKIFSVLSSVRAFLSDTNPALAAEIFALQQQAVKAIAELGIQTENSKNSTENDAFIYLLRLMAASPEFTPIIVPFFSDKKSAPAHRHYQETGILEWVEDQKTIDRIGQLAATSESLPELLYLLAQVPEIRITSHHTADFSTSHSLSSIISFINAEIKRFAISPDESLDEITEKYEEVEQLLATSGETDMKSLFPPNLGIFKTRAFVYEELKRALKSNIKIEPTQTTSVDACKSWVELMWLIENEIEPDKEFVFTIKIKGGAEKIIRLSGEVIKDIVEQAPLKPRIISALPKKAHFKFIQPDDRILVGLREKLASFLH